MPGALQVPVILILSVTSLKSCKEEVSSISMHNVTETTVYWLLARWGRSRNDLSVLRWYPHTGVSINSSDSVRNRDEEKVGKLISPPLRVNSLKMDAVTTQETRMASG